MHKPTRRTLLRSIGATSGSAAASSGAWRGARLLPWAAPPSTGSGQAPGRPRERRSRLSPGRRRPADRASSSLSPRPAVRAAPARRAAACLLAAAFALLAGAEAARAQTAATVESAATNAAGTQVIVTFSKNIDADLPGAASAYTVTVAGTNRSPTGVSASDKTVTLDLDTAHAVQPGQTVTVGYAKPAGDADKLTDSEGREVASFSGKAVTNNTPDSTPPALSGAAVNGAVLTLAFDETLDAGSVPATWRFIVRVRQPDHQPEDLLGTGTATIDGATVSVTLQSAVAYYHSVTLTYWKGTEASPLRDAAGNEVAGFSGKAVTNNTPWPPDETAPAFNFGQVTWSTLKVTFGESLDARSLPAGSSFTATATAPDGTARSIAGTGTVAIASRTVTVILASPARHGETVTVTYAKPRTNPLRDAADNEVAGFSGRTVTNNSLEDDTAPAFSRAAVNGTVLRVVFDESLDKRSLPAGSAFTATAKPAGGAARDIAGTGTVAVGGGRVSTVTVTLASAVAHGEAVTVAYAKPGSNPLRDAAGNEVAAFSGRTAANDSAADNNGRGDNTPPAFSGAAVNGATLTLTFDEALDEWSLPAYFRFFVTATPPGGSGRGRDILGTGTITVYGATVTVALESAVARGEAVTVTYWKGTDASPLRDAAGNEVADFSGKTATNDTPAPPDETAPAFSSAAVNGATLTLAFDEELDEGSLPAGVAFTVIETPLGGSYRHIAGTGTVTVDGATVTVTLERAAAHGVRVRLSYRKPGSSPLRDAAGNEVVGFTFLDLTNDTPAPGDGRAPAFSSGAVNGTVLRVVFDESLDTGSPPAGSRFWVSTTVDGTSYRAVPGTGTATVDGATVTVILKRAVVQVERATVDYLKGGNPLRDLSGAEVVSFTGRTVTNDTPAPGDGTAPDFSSAAVDGAALTVTFDEDLDEWSLPAGSAFTATATPPVGAARDIAGTGTVAIDEVAVTLTLAAAVAHGETVTVAYAKPGSNPLRDHSGNEAATFTGRTVTNRTPDTTAPSVSSVSFTSTPRHDTDGDATAETYGAGDAVDVTVVFSEAVTVDAASGTPSLALTVGSGTRAAAWASGSGTPSLVFRYTAAAGDLDADGLSIGADALALNGGTLKDASDNAASLTHAALAAQAGHRVDGAPPALQGATLDGASLTLTFDEDLATLGAAQLDELRYAFLVQGAHHLGTPVRNQSPSAITIDGKTATLALGMGVLPAREASVEYDTGITASSGTGLRDAVGNAVGSFLRSVRSSTAGAVAPLLERAEVAGTALTLTFDAALDAASAPAGSRFQVWIEPEDPYAQRDAVRGTGVAHVDGAVVRVRLASPVGQHDSARLGYWTGDDENPLRAAGAGPVAADIGAFPAVVLDRTPPELTHAVATGAAVTLYYSESLDRQSTPTSDDFTVAVSGGVEDPDVTGVAVHDTAVTLALGSTIAADRTATVSYTPGTEPVRDPAGNDAEPLSNETLANKGGTNADPPVLAAEDADADPPVYPAVVDRRVLTLTYVHPLDPAHTPSKEAFSLSAPGLWYPVEVESVAVRGASVELGLRPEVHPCHKGLTVRYVKPGENALRNVWGTDAEGLSGQAVTNANAHRCAEPFKDRSANAAVADARAREGVDAAVAFPVSLSRAATGEVTVEYVTRDGTAKAGEDYERTRGTLNFAVGETGKTVSVPLLDDGHDEGEETFTLELRNAKGAWIVDGEATGTIVNSDPIPKAWLARFGRTVTDQVLDAVGVRLAAPRQAGAEAALAGQALPSWTPGSEPGAGNAPERTALAGGDPGSGTGAGNWRAADAMRRWMRFAGAEDKDGTAGLGAGGFGGDPKPGLASRTLTPRDLLTGTSFALTAQAGGPGGGFASLWGRGAVSAFDGREGNLTLDGEVTTGLIGADRSSDPGARSGSGSGSGAGSWTAGLAIGHSTGTGGYRSGRCGEGDCGGEIEAELTGLYPYAGAALTDRLSVWLAAGYGAGEVTVRPDGVAPFAADLTMSMGAAGLRSEVLKAADAGGLSLALKGDGRFTRTESDAAGNADGGNLAAAEHTDVWMLRTGIEGSRRFAFGDGKDRASVTPSFEIGLRLDGGDAETGFGADMGGGLAFADPANGLTLDMKARALAAHEASGFREWGASASFAWGPRPDTDRGLSLSLTRSWGASPSGGMDALLSRETLADLAANENGSGDGSGFRAAGRLEGEIGCGLPAFGGGFTATPNFGFGLSDNGAREYRIGWQLTSAVRGDPGFEIRLDATRKEPACRGTGSGAGYGAGAPVEHGVTLRAAVRW